MTCDVADVIEKDRQYALGWLRLYGEQTSTAAEMGQYALDLLKLKNAHMTRCWICSQNIATSEAREGHRDAKQDAPKNSTFYKN